MKMMVNYDEEDDRRVSLRLGVVKMLLFTLICEFVQNGYMRGDFCEGRMYDMGTTLASGYLMSLCVATF